MSKDIKELVRDLRSKGWEVTRSESTGHYKAKSPLSGRKISIPGTPSDYRSYENTLADLKRAGYDPSPVLITPRKPRGANEHIPFLKKLRTYRNLSQDILAKRAGITKNRVVYAERSGNMRSEEIEKVAQVLDFSPDELRGKVLPSILFEEVTTPEAPAASEGPRETSMTRDGLKVVTTGLPPTETSPTETSPTESPDTEETEGDLSGISASVQIVRHEFGPETLARIDRMLEIFEALATAPGTRGR